MNRQIPAAALRGAVRTWILGLLLGYAVTPAFGQSLGARAGMALSSVHFTDDFAAESTPFTPGLTAGGFATLRLPWQLAVQIEGQFVLERATVDEGAESRFRYVEVPVLIKRALPWLAIGQNAVTIEGGAVYRRLLSATDNFEGESFSITDGVRADDLALVIGAEIPASSRWSVDVRYLHGQNGVYRRFNGSYSGRWRSVQIAAHYALKR